MQKIRELTALQHAKRGAFRLGLWLRGRYFRALGKEVFHFLHIGKTGGSAVKHSLGPYQDHGAKVINLHNHYTLLRDVPRGEKYFFFVRDPIERFISGFHSRQRKGKPRYEVEWSEVEERAFNEFTSPNELALGLSSNDPGIRDAAVEAMRGIVHVRRSYWHWFHHEEYFRSRWNDLFFVGFQERLAKDFTKLVILLGLPTDLRLPSDPVIAHKNPNDTAIHISRDARRNLKDWYSSDYEFVELCRKIYTLFWREPQ